MSGLVGRALAVATHRLSEQKDPQRHGAELGDLVRWLEADGLVIGSDDPWMTLRSAINAAHDLFEHCEDATWVWKPETGLLQGVPESGKALADITYAYVVERYPRDRIFHYQEVAVALARRGVNVKGPDRGRTVRAALAGDTQRFVMLGRGQWRWRE